MKRTYTPNIFMVKDIYFNIERMKRTKALCYILDRPKKFPISFSLVVFSIAIF